MRILTSALLFPMMFAATARAQSPVPAACRQAASMMPGQQLPGPADSSGIGWYVLAGCGSVANSAFAQVLATRIAYAEPDSQRVQLFFGLFWGNRQSDLFTALLSAAKNPAGTDYFRFQVVGAIGAMYTTAFEMSSRSFVIPFPASCGISGGHGGSTGGPSDLPADYLAQITQTMQAVENDGSASTRVRADAHCWRTTLAERAPPDPSKIQLSYVCNQRFRVRSTNPSLVTLTGDVTGATALSPKEPFGFTVGPGVDFFFQTSVNGTVRLFLNGALIATAVNGGTACH